MTAKPSVDDVRRRVRLLATPELLLIAMGLGNVEISGPAPADALARMHAMREETNAELARRGLTVLADPTVVGVASYRGGGHR